MSSISSEDKWVDVTVSDSIYEIHCDGTNYRYRLRYALPIVDKEGIVVNYKIQGWGQWQAGNPNDFPIKSSSK